MSLFSTVSILALEPTQLSVQWIPEADSAGVKELGNEADHSSPSSSEVTNSGA
jgi:hypothetical protein